MKQPVELNNQTILVTGSPGFIGANLVMRLLRDLTGGHVISFDNMNDYYDPKLKEYRLAQIEKAAETSPVKHTFIKGTLADKALIDRIFNEYHPAVVVNLAAQAGVRYSIDHPDVYIESNIIGFYNILEACRQNPVEHLGPVLFKQKRVAQNKGYFELMKFRSMSVNTPNLLFIKGENMAKIA